MNEKQAILDDIFTYHSPNEDDILKYKNLREKAKEFATLIIDICPACPDRSSALRKVRESLMTANASIALEGKDFHLLTKR